MNQVNSEEFEEIVGKIVNSILEKNHYIKKGQINSGPSNKIKGKSGFRHQIDVSIRDKKTLMLVECKCWKNRIKAEQILAFIGRIMDIKPLHNVEIRGIMVTKVGMQSGAIKLAEYYNIYQVIVRSENNYELKNDELLLISPGPAY